MPRAMDKVKRQPARSRFVQRIIHRLCDGTQILLVVALLCRALQRMIGAGRAERVWDILVQLPELQGDSYAIKNK